MDRRLPTCLLSLLSLCLVAQTDGEAAHLGPDPTEATELRHGFELEHRRLRIACVGDSITWGLKAVPFGLPSYPELLQEQLGNDSVEVLNFGHCTKCLINNGDDPYANTDEFKWSVASDPDIVVIMLGTNDARNANFNKAMTSYIPDYIQFVKKFQSLPSKPKVFIATPPPIVQGEFSPGWNRTFQNLILPRLVREVAAKAEIEDPIDVHGAFLGRCPKGFWSACDWISDDGIHPSPEGYVGIAASIEARVSPAATSQLAALRRRATGTLRQKVHSRTGKGGALRHSSSPGRGATPQEEKTSGSWWHFW